MASLQSIQNSSENLQQAGIVPTHSTRRAMTTGIGTPARDWRSGAMDMPLRNEWWEIFSEKPMPFRRLQRCEVEKPTLDPTPLTANNDPEPLIVIEPIAHRRTS
jgi:hypothetical protein